MYPLTLGIIASAQKTALPPPIPTANLVGWFKSDSGVTTSSGQVTEWASDYVTSGLKATSQSVKPTLTGNLNGYTAVTMPSGSLPMLFNNTLAISSAYTIFSVFKLDGAYAEYVLTRSGGGMVGAALTPGFGGPGIYLFDGGNLAIGGQNLTSAQYSTWQSSSAGSNLWQNGTQVVTSGSQVNGANPNGLFSNNSTGNIYMWETIIYDTALTPLQVSQIETYLSTKYGIVSDYNAQAYIEKVLALGGTLTTTEKNAVNTLTIDLKSAGVYSKCDLVLPVLGGNAGSSKVNLIDPTNASTDWTYLGTLGFSSTGIKGNNIDGTVRSNFKINGLTKAALGNAHYASYRKYYTSVVQGSSTGNNEDGAIDSNANYSRYGVYGYSGGGIGGMYSNDYSSGLASSNFNGLIFANSTAASSSQYFINNSSIGTGSGAQTAFTSDTGLALLGVYWWAFNDTRVYGRSPDEIRFYSIGSGLNSTERTALYNAVQTYQTTLGRNV
jgi:hypothetical protein